MTYKIYFSNAGVPATGLTPTWNSLKKVSDGTNYTPQPAIYEVGGGWYKTSLTPSEDLTGVIDGGAALGNSDRYVSVDMTANDANLDAAVSSRSTLTAADVWSAGTRTLTGFGTLVADIWSAVTRTLTGSSVVLPVMQGAVYEATAMQSREVRIVRGDTPRITFDLGADYTGWTIKFGAKANLSDTTYAIAVKDGTWTDASKGQGYVDLTSVETANAGVLIGELELRNGDQRLTAIRFKIVILEDVID